MATTHKYATPNTIETVLSTELNTLAAGTAAISAAIDNSSGLYKYADFETYTGQNITAGDCLVLYLQESEDGTNYEDNGAADRALSQLIGSVDIKVGGGGFTRHILRGFLLPPTKFKVVFIQYTSGALAGSGNTVKMIRYNEQDV